MAPASAVWKAGAAGSLLAVLILAGVAVLARGGGPADRTGRPAASGVAHAGQVIAPVRPLPSTCSRTARSADELTREFEAAAAGETICLAAGSYGTFRAGEKPGTVGIRPEAGADVRIRLDFEPAANVHVEGVTVTGAVIGGASHDVTVARSRFTGIAVVLADRMADARIRFDGNVHADIDTCTSCYQGRLHVEGGAGRPSGVVISNSVFSGGNSDGVRADAAGVRILGNEFSGLRDQDPFHTDPIQLYGGTRTVIRGNWFHDNRVSAQIMMADGGAHNLVEDNVVSPGGYTWAMTWFADDGSVIRHNTFADGQCNDDVRCGMLNLGAKAQNPPGRGTVIRDNVMTGLSNGGGGRQSAFTADHNLTLVPPPGSADITGLPDYRGPANTYAGHRLAPGSPGARRASDGTDTGIR